MSKNYGKYSKCFERSVRHIFNNFLKDQSIANVVENQATEDDLTVWIEVEGSFRGEVILRIPEKTLTKITVKLNPTLKGAALKKMCFDVLGEIANMITGTYANQLQYLEHEIFLSPPEFETDPISLKTFYENVSFSFVTDFGGFDAEVYFKDE